MAGIKISQLNNSLAFTGSEYVPIVQSGATVKTTISDLTQYAAPDPGNTGFWPDVTSTASIHRTRDRLFVNEGCSFTGNLSGTQGGFLPNSSYGANWAPRDSLFFSASQTGLIAVAGFASNENISLSAGPTECIGVGGFTIGKNATTSCWGLYSDVQFESGQYGYGVEIAVKNKGSNVTSTPYFATTGTYGIWLPAGGDASYGGSPTNPNNTAIAIGKNASTWNKGIVFFKDSLTGCDGTTGTATAIEMAKGHSIFWRAPGNYAGFTIRSDVSSSSSDVAIVATNNLISCVGAAGTTIFSVANTTSAVNYMRITNAITTNAPVLSAIGTDSDIDITITPKGSGKIKVGYASVAATVPANFTADRYLSVKDDSGNTYYIPCKSTTW